MRDTQLGTNDFDISFRLCEDESAAVINHLVLSEEHRGQGHGSFVIETAKRIAFETHNVDRLEVSIGGGENTEEFLKRNGFEIIRRREYCEQAKENLSGEYGVDAVYKSEWTSEDYNPNL
jgi:ribosomal protein S18 acetylase RimI-like enzyme